MYSSRECRAYPRSRGATRRSTCGTWPHLGLSPLARGNREHVTHFAWRLGPIPARAGQPLSRRTVAGFWRAYPRSRGATKLDKLSPVYHSGLSPLARGNLAALRAARASWGPIPARAGQPAAGGTVLAATGAYPRSRGATMPIMDTSSRRAGLSPLARGNLFTVCKLARGPRPIPARAGQPRLHDLF